MKFGLLLPHFGEHAGKEKLLEGSKLAEDVGFDSVWVRDHLVFEPHGEMEKPNRTFYDALTTLTAIGAVTNRIELGTGSLIPFRHPLVTALMAGTITQLVGPRLILGFGAGTFDHEFEAIEWGDRDRVELVRSNAEILRRVFTENDVDYSDDNFTFRDVTIEPKPRRRPDSVLVLRCHTAVGPAGGGVLRRLDAGADLAGHHGQAHRDHAGPVRRAGQDHADDRGHPADEHRGDARGGAEARQHPRPAGVGQQGQVRGEAAVGQVRDGRGPRGPADRRAARTRRWPRSRSSRISAPSTWSSTSGSSSTGSSTRSSCWARRCFRIFVDEAMRVETDSMGSMALPADALYGIHTARALDNFSISGIASSTYPEFVDALVAVKQAAALANQELGILDQRRAEAIVSACEEIRSGRFHDSFVVDVIQGGAGTSTNMNTNEVIANRALELMGHRPGEYVHLHPLEHVNLSQSTNDTYPTAIKVAVQVLIGRLNATLADLASAFRAKAHEFVDVIKMGRTQLQDAVPMTLGQEFGTYAVMVTEDADRLAEARLLVSEINLGGTAIGTGLNADPRYPPSGLRKAL